MGGKNLLANNGSPETITVKLEQCSAIRIQIEKYIRNFI